jgi:hypothetical protein
MKFQFLIINYIAIIESKMFKFPQIHPVLPTLAAWLLLNFSLLLFLRKGLAVA